MDEAASKTYLTLDGSTPVASEPYLYDGSATQACGDEPACSICVQDQSTTLKFFSVDLSSNVEAIRSKFYFYNSQWSDPEDGTPPSVTVLMDGTAVSGTEKLASGPVTVTFSTSEGAEVFYTLDGSTPTTASTTYQLPLTVTATSTLRYFARDWSGNMNAASTKSIKVYTWRQVAYTGTMAPIANQPSLKHGMIYDSKNQRFLLFCYGRNAGAPRMYSYSSGVWAEVTGVSFPGAMSSMTNVAFSYHAADEKAYLFSTGNNTAMTVFSFDGTAWTTLAGADFVATGSPWGVSSSYNPVAGNIVVAQDNFNGTIDTRRFTNVAGTATFSAGVTVTKNFSAMSYFPPLSATIAYGKVGGTFATTFVGETYSYDGSAWTAIATLEVPPVAGLVYDPDRSVAIGFGGGGDGTSTASNQTWEFDGLEWRTNNPAAKPKARQNPFIGYDSTSKKVVVFGGSDRFGQILSDMWEYSY